MQWVGKKCRETVDSVFASQVGERNRGGKRLRFTPLGCMAGQAADGMVQLFATLHRDGVRRSVVNRAGRSQKMHQCIDVLLAFLRRKTCKQVRHGCARLRRLRIEEHHFQCLRSYARAHVVEDGPAFGLHGVRRGLLLLSVASETVEFAEQQSAALGNRCTAIAGSSMVEAFEAWHDGMRPKYRRSAGKRQQRTGNDDWGTYGPAVDLTFAIAVLRRSGLM